MPINVTSPTSPHKGNGTPHDHEGVSKGMVTLSAQDIQALNNTVAEFRSSASTIVERFKTVTEHGLSFFSGSTALRDQYIALGYRKAPNNKVYRELYERGDIARRLVDLFPEEVWSEGFEVQENEDPTDTTRWEGDFKDLYDRLDLANVFMRLDILAQLGRYAVLYIGVAGDTDPSQPLREGALDSPDSILYLTPLEEEDAAIAEKVGDKNRPGDLADERYGKPLYYTLHLGDNRAAGLKVHHSRCIHVADRALKNPSYGEPLLKAVLNRLDDKDKVLGAWAEAAWRRIDPGRQYDFPPDAELTPEMKDELDDQIDRFNHGLLRDLKTRGLKITEFGFAQQLAQISQTFMIYARTIAATYDIPTRRLFGSETGERSTTEDNKRFNKRIAQKRVSYGEKLFIRPFLSFLDTTGALPLPDTFKVRWPKQETLSETDKSTQTADIAKANKDQMEATGEPVMTSDEMRRKFYDMGELKSEDIPEPPPSPEPSIPDTPELEINRDA